MKTKEFSFPSSSALCDIKCKMYIPDGEIKYILQIVHGMQEYFGRYDAFATFLASKDVLVVGCDLLGHGNSTVDDNHLGYFAPKDGDLCVLKDIHELTLITKKEYPNIPYYILGHSMGSFFVRRYMFTYDEDLAGMIIMGTGYQALPMIKAGKLMANLISKTKGEFHRSKLITSIAFSSYNNKFEKRTYVDWLTKDQSIVDKYVNDKYCNYLFTANGFYNMFSCIESLYDKNNLNKMNKDLKLLLVSGQDDPVGDYSKGVNALYDLYLNLGMKKVTKKLYPSDRHEILNEFDKQDVYQDIYDFIQS